MTVEIVCRENLKMAQSLIAVTPEKSPLCLLWELGK